MATITPTTCGTPPAASVLAGKRLIHWSKHWPTRERGVPGMRQVVENVRWARQDLNLQPDRYERPALTIELRARGLATARVHLTRKRSTGKRDHTATARFASQNPTSVSVQARLGR